MKNTKVTVTVSYEMEYDGEVTEEDIDLNDIIESLFCSSYRDANSITDIKVKTKVVNKDGNDEDFRLASLFASIR